MGATGFDCVIAESCLLAVLGRDVKQLKPINDTSNVVAEAEAIVAEAALVSA